MSDPIFREHSIEKAINTAFGLPLPIGQMIIYDMPLSRTSSAQVFLTPDKHLYVYIEARSNFNLGDVKKLISRMGLIADKYLPYRGQPDYFEAEALKKYKVVFPGRSNVTDEDLAYYHTLVPYHPALVQIAEVKDGNIYQFDSDSTSSWRVAKKFAYRRLITS